MAKIAAIDFDSLDTAAASEQPYEFELTHPSTKEGLGVFVSVVGPESAEFKNRVRREVNRNRRREFEAKRRTRHSRSAWSPTWSKAGAPSPTAPASRSSSGRAKSSSSTRRT
jgi:hypothetical protein